MYTIEVEVSQTSDKYLNLTVYKPTWIDVAAWCKALESVVGESEGMQFVYTISKAPPQEITNVS